MKEREFLISRTRVRSRLIMLGLTQNELAHKLGIATGSMSRKMNGFSTFDESEIIRLKNILGKEIFYAEPSSQNTNKEKGEA